MPTLNVAAPELESVLLLPQPASATRATVAAPAMVRCLTFMCSPSVGQGLPAKALVSGIFLCAVGAAPSVVCRRGHTARYASVGQDLAEEVLGPIGLGVGEELLGDRLLDDLPVGHEDDLICRTPGEPHLVGHDDHRHALAGQAGHHVEDL